MLVTGREKMGFKGLQGSLSCSGFPLYVLFFFLIYLAVLGLSCSMQDLFSCGMGTLSSACGIQFPDQALNPGPLHWERGVLATGPPGKSQDECSDRKRTNLVCSLFPPSEDTTRWPSANQHVGHHQTSDRPSLQTVRNKFLVFKLSSLQYSLIAADVFNIISPQGFNHRSRVLSSPKPISREFFLLRLQTYTSCCSKDISTSTASRHLRLHASPTQGMWVIFLVRALRFHKLCCVAKRKKKKKGRSL